MRILITAGPTREPIDPVRYIGNRSSGKMGAALASAALKAGHLATLIAGPVTVEMPANVRRFDVETAAEMLDATLRHWPTHDLLIMAAAVADYRPIRFHSEKLRRQGTLVIECQATEDIAAAASRNKRPNQRTVGFSLETGNDIDRARQKLIAKNLDLIVFNPPSTIDSATVEPVLIYPNAPDERLSSASKADFADILLDRAVRLFS